MSQSYIVQVTVTKIEILDDGNPNGGLELWASLDCAQLNMRYSIFEKRKKYNTGDVLKAAPMLFTSLFTKVNVTNQSKVRFTWSVASGEPIRSISALPPGATAGIDINLATNAARTTWFIETHVVRVTGGVAKVKISFDMKTKAFEHNVNRMPSVWGCSEVNGGGAAVDLTAPSRRRDEYPLWNVGTWSYQKVVWRTDFNQMGAVGNDQISSLVGGVTPWPCVVILHEHSFGDPRFATGRHQEIVLGQDIVNLAPMGLIAVWPPKPNLDNQVSAVEVALFEREIIH